MLLTAFLLLLQIATIHPHPQLPDHKLTPGATFTTDAKLICAASFRTSKYRHTSAALKKRVCTEYSVKDCPREGKMELDHLIPIELGGADVQANLWVQLAPEYHVKDVLENKLHQLVCEGKVSLPVAQQAIAEDWVAAYETYIGPLPKE